MPWPTLEYYKVDHEHAIINTEDQFYICEQPLRDLFFEFVTILTQRNIVLKCQVLLIPWSHIFQKTSSTQEEKDAKNAKVKEIMHGVAESLKANDIPQTKDGVSIQLK